MPEQFGLCFFSLSRLKRPRRAGADAAISRVRPKCLGERPKNFGGRGAEGFAAAVDPPVARGTHQIACLAQQLLNSTATSHPGLG